jgi:hypothetical protein
LASKTPNIPGNRPALAVKTPPRGREFLDAETGSDDSNLLNLQEQVEDFVREAKRRDPSEPNELVSTVLDIVARDYFRHAILKQRRRARVWPSNK